MTYLLRANYLQPLSNEFSSFRHPSRLDIIFIIISLTYVCHVQQWSSCGSFPQLSLTCGPTTVPNCPLKNKLMVPTGGGTAGGHRGAWWLMFCFQIQLGDVPGRSFSLQFRIEYQSNGWTKGGSGHG